MAQLIAAVREKGRRRDAIADALLHDIADGESLALERKDGLTAIVGPDVSKAGSFRVTRLDGAAPIGHTEASNMRKALRQALLDGFVHSERVAQANGIRSIDGGSVSKVDDLREGMSAVVREAQAYGKYGSSRVREPISVLGRTGALQLVEANDAE